MSKKLPKNEYTWKIKYFETLQKLPKNVGDLGKINGCHLGFEKLPKVQ